MVDALDQCSALRYIIVALTSWWPFQRSTLAEATSVSILVPSFHKYFNSVSTMNFCIVCSNSRKHGCPISGSARCIKATRNDVCCHGDHQWRVRTLHSQTHKRDRHQTGRMCWRHWEIDGKLVPEEAGQSEYRGQWYKSCSALFFYEPEAPF